MSINDVITFFYTVCLYSRIRFGDDCDRMCLLWCRRFALKLEIVVFFSSGIFFFLANSKHPAISICYNQSTRGYSKRCFPGKNRSENLWRPMQNASQKLISISILGKFICTYLGNILSKNKRKNRNEVVLWS